ncbi:MAG: UDP-N-acetylmuramoyl-tripeptide--D-alanyl-D-alanine ligase [Proteobacteria bacterium]|nr:UDP-N-acetylmuramoyl-tripeptide--D-alanyl-D-alanine ligase [Pseudomonadota bacterium]
MSAAFQLGDAVRWTGASLRRGAEEKPVTGVSIDSRAIASGELFVAIRGPRHDAHSFLSQALEAGAAALVVERGRVADDALPGDTAVLEVDDTTAALGSLAAGHRATFRGPVVAVTGSSGKTTTKEMCASILSVRAACLKNEGNLNNEFGLPLTLLRLRPEHQSAVVELGMNHRGEIARLAAISAPTVGLVTNVGIAHIEFLGSRDEIAREKGDLFAALAEDGIAVVNRDDARVGEQARRAPGAVLGYSTRSNAEVVARKIRFLDEGTFTFDLTTPEGEISLRVPGLGETTVINATAAAAAALAAGASLDDIRTGLGAYRNVGGRMARIALAGDVTLIDDTYNANPQSLRAALETLARLKGDGRGLAVVGDMGELGDDTEEAHRQAGRAAAELGVDFLFALGERAPLVAEAAAAAGMDGGRARAVPDHAAASRAVRDLLRPRDWVLVKGSRAMQMERVVAALTSKETG